MSAEGELVSVEKDLKSLKNRIEDRLQSVRNELDRDTTCRIKTCHKKKYRNDKCEGHYLRDKHASRLYDKYDKPIASLAVQLMEFNVEEWIPDKDGTIGADHIRETGLTRTQRKWLGQMNAKSESSLEDMREEVQSRHESNNECHICGGVQDQCSCVTAITHVMCEGIDGGVEDE